MIFNHSLGVWQCVSEIARAKGKSKTLKTVVLAMAVAVSGQVSAADNADYFGGGLSAYNKGDYHLTRTANVFNGGTVLNTNSITNDGQVLNIYDNAKTISKNAVNV